jgi:putative membrane protein
LTRRRAALASIVGGLVGGLIGAGVMSAGHAAITTVMGREPASAAAQEEDATVKVADRLSRAARGRPLDPSEKPVAGHVVHYGFGAAMGLLYGAAAVAVPAVTVASGAAFGAAVWLGAHAIVVPALGLARSPLQQPLSKEAIELILHVAYGLTVGLVRRGAVRISR